MIRKKFKKGEKILIKRSGTPGVVKSDEENGVVAITANGTTMYMFPAELKRQK